MLRRSFYEHSYWTIAMSHLATGSAAERLAEYRKRAEEMCARAADASDKEAREFFMEIALAYTGMAHHLESKLLGDELKTPAPVENPNPTPQRPMKDLH